MTYTTYGTGNFHPAEAETMDMARVQQAFADLNRVLAEEGSLYGVSGVFSRDTLIRSQVIYLSSASEEDMVETQKTYTSTSTAYRRDQDGNLKPVSTTVGAEVVAAVDADAS